MNPRNVMKILQSVDFNYDIPIMERQESLINNRFQSDVTFLVGKKRQPIYAHKLLLIISSEYFNVMFNGNFKESNSEEIAINDVEPDIFLEILRFIYCGKVHLTIENVLEIFVHAQMYMLNELRQQSIEYFEKSIAFDNVLKFFAQNRLYELSFINEKCLKLIMKNPLLCFNHEDFYVLDRKSLEIIISSKKFNCSKTQVLQALRDWSKINEIECVSDLETMINTKHVRDCSKLRFFGNISSNTSTGLTFMFQQPHSLALYGIGVFVKSSAKMITIEVKISNNPETLGLHQFEYENKDVTTVSVAKLFFQELTLLPNTQYSIGISFNPGGQNFSICNPYVIHGKHMFKLMCNDTYSVISHFYYDEIEK
nr:BTB/POZ domain-containing protein 6-like [Aedes albopictus]